MSVLLGGETLPSAASEYACFASDKWWNIACRDVVEDASGGEQESGNLGDTLKSICERAGTLLKACILSSLDKRFKGASSHCAPYSEELDCLFESEFISELVGKFELNAIGVRASYPLHSDLAEFFRREEDGGKEEDGDAPLKDEIEAFGSRIENFNRIVQEQQMAQEADGCDQDDEEEESQDGEGWGYTRTGGDQEDEGEGGDEASTDCESDCDSDCESSDGLSCSSFSYTLPSLRSALSSSCGGSYPSSCSSFDKLFPPLDGTALFSTACRMNHSCSPNVLVKYIGGWGRKRPLALQCYALRDIREGEQLCISYIDVEMDAESRQAALDNYGFTCRCEKCLADRGELQCAGGSTGAASGNDDDENIFGSDSDSASDDDENNIFGNDSEEEEDGEEEQQAINLPPKPPDLHNLSIHSPQKRQNLQSSCVLAPSIYTMAASFVGECLSDLGSAETSASLSPQLKQSLTCLSDAVRSKDFLAIKIHSTDANDDLLRGLHERKVFAPPVCRVYFYAAASASAMTLANEGRYMDAMEMLDNAMVLGIPKKPIARLIDFVESNASRMWHTTGRAHRSFAKREDCNYFVKDYRESPQEVTAKGLVAGKVKFSLNKVEAFEGLKSYIDSGEGVVLEKFACDWPGAKKLTDLTVLTQNYGHRRVPVEIGSMQAGKAIDEKLMLVEDLVDLYLAKSCSRGVWSLEDSMRRREEICYLAQHPLLEQIPSFQTFMPRRPEILSRIGVDVKHCSAWFGSGGTRTPLHFDSYDNLFVQLVGVKYVRLYYHDSDNRHKLYLGSRKAGSDDKGAAGKQGNMSMVDVENVDADSFPLFADLKYEEALLMPGDALYIPAGMFHYVRSLTTSFSVSYWF